MIKIKVTHIWESGCTNVSSVVSKNGAKDNNDRFVPSCPTANAGIRVQFFLRSTGHAEIPIVSNSQIHYIWVNYFQEWTQDFHTSVSTPIPLLLNTPLQNFGVP